MYINIVWFFLLINLYYIVINGWWSIVEPQILEIPLFIEIIHSYI